VCVYVCVCVCMCVCVSVGCFCLCGDRYTTEHRLWCLLNFLQKMFLLYGSSSIPAVNPDFALEVLEFVPELLPQDLLIP